MNLQTSKVLTLSTPPWNCIYLVPSRLIQHTSCSSSFSTVSFPLSSSSSSSSTPTPTPTTTIPPNTTLSSRELYRALLKTIHTFPISHVRAKLRYNVQHVFRLYQHEHQPWKIQQLHQQALELNLFFQHFKAWPLPMLKKIFKLNATHQGRATKSRPLPPSFTSCLDSSSFHSSSADTFTESNDKEERPTLCMSSTDSLEQTVVTQGKQTKNEKE